MWNAGSLNLAAAARLLTQRDWVTVKDELGLEHSIAARAGARRHRPSSGAHLSDDSWRNRFTIARMQVVEAVLGKEIPLALTTHAGDLIAIAMRMRGSLLLLVRRFRRFRAHRGHS
jgi:hypothetical protein